VLHSPGGAARGAWTPRDIRATCGGENEIGSVAPLSTAASCRPKQTAVGVDRGVLAPPFGVHSDPRWRGLATRVKVPALAGASPAGTQLGAEDHWHGTCQRNSAHLAEGPDRRVGRKRRLGRACGQSEPRRTGGAQHANRVPSCEGSPWRSRLASCAPRRHDALLCLVAIDKPGLEPKIGRSNWGYAVLPSFLRAPD
jgi:hypothetical protein